MALSWRESSICFFLVVTLLAASSAAPKYHRGETIKPAQSTLLLTKKDRIVLESALKKIVHRLKKEKGRIVTMRYGGRYYLLREKKGKRGERDVLTVYTTLEQWSTGRTLRCICDLDDLATQVIAADEFWSIQPPLGIQQVILFPRKNTRAARK